MYCGSMHMYCGSMLMYCTIHAQACVVHVRNARAKGSGSSLIWQMAQEVHGAEERVGSGDECNGSQPVRLATLWFGAQPDLHGQESNNQLRRVDRDVLSRLCNATGILSSVGYQSSKTVK